MRKFIIIILLLTCPSAIYADEPAIKLQDSDLNYNNFEPSQQDLAISRSGYVNKLHGFWLGQSIANWTGLITETRRNDFPFYTDFDWNDRYQILIRDSDIFDTDYISYMFVEEGNVWGADDDTDIEYMYQHLIDKHNNSILTGEQIHQGWLDHIHSDEYRDKYLWVSNERAYDLMRYDGLIPPATSEPENNRDYDKIDAQLTTEIFGLFAPGRPDVALKMAHLPIRTVAKNEAEWIAEFYVIMHSLASSVDPNLSMKDKLEWMAGKKHAMPFTFATSA